MGSSLTIRPARVEDVAQMARVNVRCWQETYRGLMSDAVLDDPAFPTARERFWTAALTDERYRDNRVAVAQRDRDLVGIAMSGPPLYAGADWARQLYVLYVLADDHGTGAGPALLKAVLDPEESAALWVADPNPRAQAFYRKHGFVADGTVQVEDGVREIRMVRGTNGKQVWTIGHWTCPEPDFLHPLRAQRIELLADVRALPGSRRSPQFDRDEMPRWLAHAGIDYVHLPELGGRRGRQPVDPDINAGWRQPSFKNYADYTLGSSYQQGIAHLVDLATARRVAIMCGEPMPWRCHRLLIANTLAAQGWTVWHLIDDAAPRRHEPGQWGATPSIDADGQVTYPPPEPVGESPDGLSSDQPPSAPAR